MKWFQLILVAAVFATFNAIANAEVTQIEVNVTGTVAGTGEVKLTVKDAGGDEIGCYSFEVTEDDLDDGLTRKDVVKGLAESENLEDANFEDSIGKEKEDEDTGITSSVFIIKIKREEFGAKFQICGLDDETIPGINFDLKRFNGNEQVSVEPNDINQGFVGLVDIVGKGTHWTQDEITHIDFGSGVFTESFEVISDGLISAFIFVDPLGPVGLENVWIIGDVIDSFNELVLDAVISTSNEPMFINFLPGDVNCDNQVDLLDVAPFVEVLSNGEYNPKADINGDGRVDLLDVAPFVALLSS